MDERRDIYETLLNQKAALEKDCFYFELEYHREFGAQVEELFQAKVEAVTLKKKIAYCVKKRYRNEAIYAGELNRLIDAEILAYQQKLDDLVAYNAYARNETRTIGFEEQRQIRKLYFALAHRVHPDLHPEYSQDEVILALWNKAVDAYKRNDYPALCEVNDRIMLLTSEGDIHIERLDEKIEALTKQLEEIRQQEPYTYRFLLEDREATENFHEELAKQIQDYQDYVAKLNEELQRFPIVTTSEA